MEEAPTTMKRKYSSDLDPISDTLSNIDSESEFSTTPNLHTVFIQAHVDGQAADIRRDDLGIWSVPAIQPVDKNGRMILRSFNPIKPIEIDISCTTFRELKNTLCNSLTRRVQTRPARMRGHNLRFARAVVVWGLAGHSRDPYTVFDDDEGSCADLLELVAKRDMKDIIRAEFEVVDDEYMNSIRSRNCQWNGVEQNGGMAIRCFGVRTRVATSNRISQIQRYA